MLVYNKGVMVFSLSETVQAQVADFITFCAMLLERASHF